MCNDRATVIPVERNAKRVENGNAIRQTCYDIVCVVISFCCTSMHFHMFSVHRPMVSFLEEPCAQATVVTN